MGQHVLDVVQAQIQKANFAFRIFPQGNPWRKRATHKLHTVEKQGVDIPQNGAPILSPAASSGRRGSRERFGPQTSPAMTGNK